MTDAELETFKRDIDLRQYAAEQGYTLDVRESWRGSSVMRRAGDKIVVKIDGDGHYVYFSLRDDRDNGSIIDFVQQRKRLSLGDVRRELRRWARAPAAPLPLFPKFERTARDRLQVEALYRRMQPAGPHPYLQSRGLPSSLLEAERFVGRIRTDARGNAAFAHFDEAGLCGCKIRNRGFTGFSKGGEKGLWFSHAVKGNQALALAEIAIGAMSYAALLSLAAARYASIAASSTRNRPRLSRRPR